MGALGVIVGLPVVVLGLYYSCTRDLCLDWGALGSSAALQDFGSRMVSALPTSVEAVVTPEALRMYVGWMALQLVLERVLPGEVAWGAPVKSTGSDGRPREERLPYVLSGHLQFWLTLALLAYGHPVLEQISAATSSTTLLAGVWSVRRWDTLLDLPLVYDHYAGLAVVSMAGSLLLSLYLYVRSFLPGAVLAQGGQTGSPVYDFFIGRELNPRVGGDASGRGALDLKEFCELRPGLIGWLVINLSMAAAQHRAQGAVSGSMVCVLLFQGAYVWDALYNERAILTTMDITTDGFGFMLAFGDLTWVPFIYSLQARYLVDHDPGLSAGAIAAVTAIHFLGERTCRLALCCDFCICLLLYSSHFNLLCFTTGYYIFRSANSEKDAFRSNPDAPEVAHLRYLPTQRGTKLLISGWWGAARKINYTGDWLITLSWCLLCGFDSPIPYFQAIYFLILLVHRADRDDGFCAEKYGADWDEYKRQVPYRFVPFVW